MKKNFDALKAVRTIQGADKGGKVGNQGNVNPSNQDQDTNSAVNLSDTPALQSTETGYNKASAGGMNFDGGMNHNYSGKTN